MMIKIEIWLLTVIFRQLLENLADNLPDGLKRLQIVLRLFVLLIQLLQRFADWRFGEK